MGFLPSAVCDEVKRQVCVYFARSIKGNVVWEVRTSSYVVAIAGCAEIESVEK